MLDVLTDYAEQRREELFDLLLEASPEEIVAPRARYAELSHLLDYLNSKVASGRLAEAQLANEDKLM